MEKKEVTIDKMAALFKDSNETTPKIIRGFYNLVVDALGYVPEDTQYFIFSSRIPTKEHYGLMGAMGKLTDKERKYVFLKYGLDDEAFSKASHIAYELGIRSININEIMRVAMIKIKGSLDSGVYTVEREEREYEKKIRQLEVELEASKKYLEYLREDSPQYTSMPIDDFIAEFYGEIDPKFWYITQSQMSDAMEENGISTVADIINFTQEEFISKFSELGKNLISQLWEQLHDSKIQFSKKNNIPVYPLEADIYCLNLTKGAEAFLLRREIYIVGDAIKYCDEQYCRLNNILKEIKRKIYG